MAARKSLQKRRESAGLTQKQLGELIGVKQATVSGWELGRTPPAETAERLDKILSEFESGKRKVPARVRKPSGSRPRSGGGGGESAGFGPLISFDPHGIPPVGNDAGVLVLFDDEGKVVYKTGSRLINETLIDLRAKRWFTQDNIASGKYIRMASGPQRARVVELLTALLGPDEF